jgi:hypothetical protein
MVIRFLNLKRPEREHGRRLLEKETGIVDTFLVPCVVVVCGFGRAKTISSPVHQEQHPEIRALF